MKRTEQHKDCGFTHPNGKVTNYDLTVYRHEQKPGVRVFELSNMDGTEMENAAAAHGVASLAREQYGYTPERINMYEQKPDGDYERIRFGSYGHDPHTGSVQWGEVKRDQYTRGQFNDLVGRENTLEPPRDRAQEHQESQRAQMGRGDLGLGRQEVTDAERGRMEAAQAERDTAREISPEERRQPMREVGAPEGDWRQGAAQADHAREQVHEAKPQEVGQAGRQHSDPEQEQ